MAWAPDYMTVEEYKLSTKIPADRETDDDDIALALGTASRAIDDHCNRQFGKLDAAAQRFYTAQWRADLCSWVVEIDDLMSTTDFALVHSGTSLVTYSLEPINASADGRPWTRIAMNRADGYVTGSRNAVGVTAVWGWASVPPAVKLATRLQTNRFLKRRDSPFGVAGSAEQGTELRLLAKVDVDVAVGLKNYVRPRGVG